MKHRLLLLRHAKSSWARPALADFDRPLNRRGLRAAPLMAAFMKRKNLRPDLVLCSAAERARQTWALLSADLGDDVPVKISKSLYLAPPSRLLAVVRRTPDEVRDLLVIGHNPGLERFAAGLSGPDSDETALARLGAKFPTCALAVVRFDAARWAELAEGAGCLMQFVAPRDL